MKLKTKLVIVFMVVMVFPMLFTGVMTRAFVPEKATEIQQMYLIVVSITAALLIIWIYRAVSVPLQKLQKAARNIKEGNLDFEIKAENDDEIGQLCRDFESCKGPVGGRWRWARKVMMSRPHLTKKQARTCKSVQKIIKTRFFVDNHEILLYFSFIDIISSSERLAAGKESGLNEQVERRQLSKCDYVAQELKTQIIAGKYRSGDQLPPEPALCEMFSVSRITVREALKKLSMMGLVEIKQGKGTFVKSVDLGLFMKPMLQLVDFDEIDIETIYSAREYIEGGIAYLAAQQRTDGELAILESILGKLKAAIQAGDILSIFEYDRAFHDDLARAAHNPILFACLQTIEEINEACVKRYDKFLIMLDDCYNEHFQIFTAVANQQPEKAQAAMAQHARSSKKILL